MVQDALRHRFLYEGLVSALSIGGFFIILGFVFAFTPGISDQTSNFIKDLTNVTYHLSGSSSISLLAPAHPANHQGFYSAVMNFLISVGVLQIVILVLRLVMHSRVRRIAQSVGDLIFWLGAGVMASVFLLAGTLSGWYQFWSSLIILIGLSLIARFIVHFLNRYRKKRND